MVQSLANQFFQKQNFKTRLPLRSTERGCCDVCEAISPTLFVLPEQMAKLSEEGGYICDLQLRGIL